MSGTPTRREVISGIGGVAIGTIGLTALSGESTATQIDIQSVEVPNTTQQVSSPVTGATLSISGEYSVSAEVVPTRVVLRLEAKRATRENYEQLTAEEPAGTLSKEFTEPFDFSTNLLDLEGVNAPLLTPDTVGATQEVDIDIRLTLTVKNGGQVLKEVSAEDTHTLTVEKTTAGATVGIEATGNVSVSD